LKDRIEQADRVLRRREAEREVRRAEVDDLARRLSSLDRDASEWEQARDLLVAVLLQTQGRVRGFIEDVVTLALSAVYGSEYKFELEYDAKRNQVEATPWITISGERRSPREELGGGVLDVASLALRMALWAIMEPRPSSTFLLDEPSKFLDADRQPDFGRMLVELADTLGVQFVVVTHSPALAEHGGTAYSVSQADGVSKVERMMTL